MRGGSNDSDAGDGVEGRARHLFVCQHGYKGHSTDMVFLASVLRAEHPEDDVSVLNCSANDGLLSMDGIDVCGDRLYHAVVNAVTDAHARVTKVSFIGYSMGGLVCQYAAGRLLEDGFFRRCTPMNFATVASPHLGCRREPPTFFHNYFNLMGSWVASRSGRQLFLADRYAGRAPLLVTLADPSLCFGKALAAFQNRVLLANVKNDETVTYTSASIQRVNVYENSAATPLQDYPSVVVPESSGFLAVPCVQAPLPWSVRARLLVLCPIICVFGLYYNLATFIRSWWVVRWLPAELRSRGSGASGRLGPAADGQTPTEHQYILTPVSAWHQADLDACLNYICTHKNAVGWRKVDVLIHSKRAHSDVVVRYPQRNVKQRDGVLYLVKALVM